MQLVAVASHRWPVWAAGITALIVVAIKIGQSGFGMENDGRENERLEELWQIPVTWCVPHGCVASSTFRQTSETGKNATFNLGSL